MGYSTVCNAAESGKLKGTGRSGNSQAGAEQELFWHPTTFAFADKDAALDEEVWNVNITAGNLYYIGVIEEFDANDTEPTYYESTNGNARIKTANAKRVRQYRLIECSCTHANLLSFDGQNGHLLIRTSRGYLKARLEKDGTVKGFKTSQFDVGLLTAATNDTPSFTPIDVTFANPVDDDVDVFEDKIDFEFSQLDQIFNAEIAISAAASNGTDLTFTMTITKGCSAVPLTGAVRSDFIFKNINGSVISGGALVESGTSGVYEVTLPTDETVVDADIDNIKKISSTNYVSDVVRVKVS